jgi:cation transport ATPase
MNMLIVKTASALALVAAALALLLPFSAQAQLQSVEQTVYGMDCAPCAYGLEKQMKGFDGVTGADVSLNEGLATLRLAPGNDLRLATLRKKISESGFSPRRARIEVAGTLRQEEDRWVLTAPSGERFVLEATDQAGALTDGARVTAAGTVAEGTAAPERGWTLRVESIGDAT